MTRVLALVAGAAALASVAWQGVRCARWVRDMRGRVEAAERDRWELIASRKSIAALMCHFPQPSVVLFVRNDGTEGSCEARTFATHAECCGLFASVVGVVDNSGGQTWPEAVNALSAWRENVELKQEVSVLSQEVRTLQERDADYRVTAAELLRALPDDATVTMRIMGGETFDVSVAQAKRDAATLGSIFPIIAARLAPSSALEGAGA